MAEAADSSFAADVCCCCCFGVIGAVDSEGAAGRAGDGGGRRPPNLVEGHRVAGCWFGLADLMYDGLCVDWVRCVGSVG